MKTLTQVILALAIIWMLILILWISLISVAKKQGKHAAWTDTIVRYEQTHNTNN